MNAKTALAQWATGISRTSEAAPEAEGTSRVIVLSSGAGALVDALRESGLIGLDTTVLVNAADADDAAVTYVGDHREPYAEIQLLDGFFMMTVPYALARYIPVSSPTLVRVTSEDDLAALLADAEEAMGTGIVPQFLTSPAVLLADQPAFGAHGQGGPSDRLWVEPDGSLATGPWAGPIGTVGDRLAELDARWRAGLSDDGCDTSALARAVSRAQVADATAERPWLGRYFAAIVAARALSARGIDPVRLSGIGHRLGDGLPTLRSGSAKDLGADLPFLAWGSNAGYVAARDGRLVQIGLDLANVVEAILATGPHEGGGVPTAEKDRVARWFADQGLPLEPDRTSLAPDNSIAS